MSDETQNGSGEETRDESTGVQAVETGVRVLEALAALKPAPMLKAIAEEADMPPAKAHRYLASFVRTGLVTRDSQTGRYKLGPLAVTLGLVALRRLDVVALASPLLAPLRDETGQSVFLAVWSRYGPTVVRSEETDNPLAVMTRAGSIMPLLPSSTGRVFGAYLPESETKHLLARDLQQNPQWVHPFVDSKALFEDVRQRRMARTRGELNPGIFAMSAPIFDHEGSIVAVISALGVVGSFDAEWDGVTSKALRRYTVDISASLGFREDRER